MAQLVKNPPAMWESWVGKISWEREGLPTPVFWPGKFHGLYSPWDRKELDTTDILVYMYHVFFIHSSVAGHLDCFHALPIVNSAAVNIRMHCCFELWFSSDKCPGVGLQDLNLSYLTFLFCQS